MLSAYGDSPSLRCRPDWFESLTAPRPELMMLVGSEALTRITWFPFIVGYLAKELSVSLLLLLFAFFRL